MSGEIEFDDLPAVTMSRRQVLCGLAAGSVIAVSGCATNPVTGRSQLIIVSGEQLSALSSDSWRQIKQKEPLSRSRRLNSRLRRVGNRITQAAGQGGNKWDYAVFASGYIN